MTTGKDVYESIQSKVSEQQRQVKGLYDKLLGIENDINGLTQDREDCYAKLATTYLPELTAETVKDTLKEKQSKVQAIFMEKQQKRKSLEQQISEATTQKTALKTDFDDVTGKWDDARKDRDTLRVKVHEALSKDDSYKALVVEARHLHDRVNNSTSRIRQVKDEAVQKLPEFETNKIFQYLLRRGYGTDKYVGSSIAKKLDGWIAGKINFAENKTSYDFFKSMPELMKIELDKRQSQLEEIMKKGQDAEEKYSKQYGLSAIVEKGQKYDAQRKRFIENMASLDHDAKEYEDARKALDNTKDLYHQAAVQELKDFLKSAGIAELKSRALETPSKEDDALVYRIDEIDESVRKQKDEAKSVKGELDEASEKLDKLNALASKYNSNNYDSYNSRFHDGLDIDNLLTGYMLGRMSTDNVWGSISNNHYTHQESSYSSSSSGSSFGGGSFSSGGGSFGGGGFSSGSGF